MKQILRNTFGLRAWMVVALLTAFLTGAWAESEKITFSELGLDNGTQYSDPFDGGSFTVTFGGGANDGKYYTTGSGIRVYGGGTMTIASENTIESITITYDGSNKPSSDDVVSVGTYDVETGVWTGSSNEIVFTRPAGSGHWRVQSVEVTYSGTIATKADCDLALTNAPLALSFDLYNNAQAQYISYTTSSTGEVSVVSGIYNVSCYVDENAKTISVTPFAVTNGPQTVTVSQAADGTYKAGSVTFTVTVTDSTPISKHTATFSVNGTTSTSEFQEGYEIEFPADPEAISGKKFVGWTAEPISGTTNEAPAFVTSATMGASDVTYYAVFAFVNGVAKQQTDELTNETTGVSGTSYSAWSGKTANSGAVYAGQSAGGNSSIQLRSNNNNSGVVTTTSGGKATKVEVVWNSNTAEGRTINVYGSNTAYTDASDLYGNNAGTLIGTIVCGTSTELAITGDYAYIGVRSASGALYMDKLSITWSSGSANMSDYCTTVVADSRLDPELSFSEEEVHGSIGTAFTQPALNTAAGFSGDVEYESSNESVALVMDIETGELRLVGEGTTIITATFAGNDNYLPASASYTLTVTDSRIATTIEYGPIVLDVTEVSTLTKLEPVVRDASGNVIEYTYTEFPPTVSFEFSFDDDPNSIISSIDNNSGEITLSGNTGTATLKAYFNLFDVEESYKPSECTFTITVADTNAPGAKNNPYTVAQARAAIDAGTGVKGVYATGIVSKIVTPLNTQYGNISYNISADGSTEGDQLQAYRGMSYNGDKFTSADDIQVGDVVVIYGNLTKYNTTYEFAQYSQLVSLIRTNRPATPTFSPEAGTYTSVQNVTISTVTEDATIYYTIDGTDPTTESAVYTEAISVSETTTIKAIAVTDDGTSLVGSATFTIDLEPSIVFDGTDNAFSTSDLAGSTNVHYVASNTTGTIQLVLCDAEGNAATYDWFRAEISSDVYVAVSWDANTDSENARTAYFKLTADNATSEIFAVTQAKYVADFATLPFAFDGGKKDISETSGLSHEGLGSDYNASPKLKFDGTGDCLVLKIDEAPGKLTFDIKGNGFSDGTFTVQTSEDGETYTDLQTYTELGATQNETFPNLGENVRYIKWIYTEKVSGNVALGNITLAAPGTSEGFAVNWAEGDNITLYVFGEDESEALTSGALVPEGTIVIISPDPEVGFVLKDLTVNDGEVELTYNKEAEAWTFTMPAAEVTISAATTVVGDVNGDGNISPSDAIMILYHFFKVEQAGFIEAAADLNGDGEISPADAIEALYKYFNSEKEQTPEQVRQSLDPQ